MDSEYIYFHLDSASELIPFPADDIRELDWYADLPMIQRFYRHWGSEDDEDIQPPSKTESEIGNPIALVRGGDIFSFTIPFYFNEGEVEIGAVATLPSEQNKGFCRRVISEAARRILNSGRRAALTTRPLNLAMQAAARAIGMQQTAKD